MPTTYTLAPACPPWSLSWLRGFVALVKACGFIQLVRHMRTGLPGAGSTWEILGEVRQSWGVWAGERGRIRSY